jgi:hypothetical protein
MTDSSGAPGVLLAHLDELFRHTGIDLDGLGRSCELVEGKAESTGFADHSMFLQRLYRYHDFCALELSETLENAEGGIHLAVEQRRHEVLSAAYRLAGMAVDAANPADDRGLPAQGAIDDGLAAVAGGLFVLFWAFGSVDERKALISRLYPDGVPEGVEDLDGLIQAAPTEVLDPMGELGMTAEELAEGAQVSGETFGRWFYPPLHAAASWETLADKNQARLYRETKK